MPSTLRLMFHRVVRWAGVTTLALSAGATASAQTGGQRPQADSSRESLATTQTPHPGSRLSRRVTIEMRNAPLPAVLAEIDRQAGLQLTYSERVVPIARRVTLVMHATAGEALRAALEGTAVIAQESESGAVTLIREPAAATPQNGTVSGRVTDKKTGVALAGATVVIERTSLSATTGGDGRYRIAAVVPGTYTLRARYIGYAPGTASTTVSADQEATADFALEKSAQRLDEVVTTGTVVPTEVKALPTPISVITGDEIEQKGYQRIDQIFRGDIPGALAWDNGAGGDYSNDIHIRGTSSLYVSANVKTYIDGVEVADPNYIATVDPSTIDRVEILRGPEGSTIYGSAALAGVIQIFTKKGDFGVLRPRVEAKVSAGTIESPWVGSPALQQDHSLAVTGGGPTFSYRAAGGYSRQGAWAPQLADANTSLSGGARVVQGRFSVDLSARYDNKAIDSPWDPRFLAAGYTPFSKPLNEALNQRQQTYGLTLKYDAPRWRHTLTIGFDQSGYDDYNTSPRFVTPADSFVFIYTQNATKASIGYNTTYAASFGRLFNTSLTAGVDHWRYNNGGFSTSTASSPVNVVVSSPDYAYRYQYDNTGYFAQGQLGIADALFLTAGLRAESDQNFGKDYGLAWSPRVGASVVHTLGDVTAKIRAAYGQAIRPPFPGTAGGYVASYLIQLPNPNLGPERQRGWDGGVELYVGRRASLEVTYYNQTAINLIDQVLIDATTTPRTSQNQNVGQIGNKGWEFQGRVYAGLLTFAGTYTITHSIVERLSPSYTGDLLPGDEMLHIPSHTAGATVSFNLPRTVVTAGMTWVGSWTDYDWLSLYGVYFGGQAYRGSQRDYWITYPAFTKFSLSISQALTNQLGMFLSSNNLTNEHAYERDNLGLQPGRSTMVGLRVKL